MLSVVDWPVRIGYDIHPYLIELLVAVRDGWEPPDSVSREQYYSIKADPESYDPRLVGFVGFLCSFGAKWWGGYAKNSTDKNYAAMAMRSCLRQAPTLKGASLFCGNYLNIHLPKRSVVYCDPPYSGTTKYGAIKFDHDIFWDWCRAKSLEGHSLYISEYTAPADFECVWRTEVSTRLNRNSVDPRIECLFKYSP